MVNLDNRRDLRGRPREKALISGVEHRHAEKFLAHGDSFFQSQLDHDFAGDAGQIRHGRRHEDRPVLHDEDVIGRALGDKPIAIEHNRFVDTREVRLDLGHDIREIVQGFYILREAIGGAGAGVGHNRSEATLTLLLSVERFPLLDNDDDRRLAVAASRVHSQIPHPARHDRANICAAQFVDSQGF